MTLTTKHKLIISRKLAQGGKSFTLEFSRGARKYLFCYDHEEKIIWGHKFIKNYNYTDKLNLLAKERGTPENKDFNMILEILTRLFNRHEEGADVNLDWHSIKGIAKLIPQYTT